MSTSPESPPAAPALTPQIYRRNVLAFGCGMGLFAVGESIFGANTVIPAFVSTLTDSEVLVGLASGLNRGAWLLPQLFVAGYVTRMPRKRPFMVRMATLRGPALLPLALATWLLASQAPALTLIVLLLSIILFYGLDAGVSVPFMDMMARGLPTRRRGRVQGMASILGGVGGMAAGVLVKRILEQWAYPGNFGALFGLASLVFIAVGGIHALIVEPPALSTVTSEPPSVRSILGSLPDLLRRDPGFMWLIVVRVVAGFVLVASAFYVLYATTSLGFSTADTGLFVSAQVAGLFGSGLMIGVVQDRWGPRAHQRLVMVISLLPPALALLTPLVPPGPGLRALMIGIFVLVGVSLSNMGWPYVNWVMEHAPEEQRPLYFGVTNTVAALFTLAPVLGGVIVRQLSYPAVFIAAIGFGALGLLLSRKVPSTR